MTCKYKLWILIGIAALIATCTAFPQVVKEHELTMQSDDQPATTPSMSIESSCLEQRAQEAKNKEIAMGAYQEVFGDHNIEAADKYFHHNVIQHNPLEGDGVESFKKFATFWTKSREKEKIDFHRVSAEGDLVWTHVKMRDNNGKDLAFMDIFRIENGKIAEHWDVIQKVPELSQSKNSHPLF